MKVTIRFPAPTRPNREARERLVGLVLGIQEETTCKWFAYPGSENPHKLVFVSDRTPAQIFENLEDEGYELDDFESIKFTR